MSRPSFIGCVVQRIRSRLPCAAGPAQIDATWRMLQAVNRINLARWQASQAMRAEAARWQEEGRWSS